MLYKVIGMYYRKQTITWYDIIYDLMHRMVSLFLGELTQT